MSKSRKKKFEKFRLKPGKTAKEKYYANYINEVIDLLDKNRYEEAIMYLDKALDYLVLENLSICDQYRVYQFHLYKVIDVPRAIEYLYDFGHIQGKTLNYFMCFKNFRNLSMHLITGKEGAFEKKMKLAPEMRSRGLLVANYIKYKILFEEFGEGDDAFDKFFSKWKRVHEKRFSKSKKEIEIYLQEKIESGLRAYIGLVVSLLSGAQIIHHFDPEILEKESEFIRKDPQLYRKCLKKATKKMREVAKSSDLDPFRLFE